LTDAPPSPTPLDGLLVADFSRILAGPLVTQNLAHLGARVIKVERPGAGDETRTWQPPVWGDLATYFAGLNSGKESVALDLESDGDRRLARNLALRADVLVENFRPGVMDGFGLGASEITSANPRLVYCSISAFGDAGAAKDLPGVDLLIQAMAGWMHVTGQPDGPPTKVGMAVVDVVAGMYATTGVLAALHRRAAVTGRGDHVKVSLFHAALAGLVNLGSGHLLAGDDPTRDGNRHPSIAPYELVRASDRPFILAAVNDGLFARTCEAIGRPELIHDPRFETNPDRRRHVEVLINELEAVFTTRPAGEWISILRAVRVPVGDVNTVAEAFSFADDLGLDLVSHDPRTGFRDLRSPVVLTETESIDPAAPPELDQHGDAIRQWLSGDA
jgi:crotonobetainyl-CoA:carnitine CoA-transferase CaiB-like acyl-CoA transferase